MQITNLTINHYKTIEESISINHFSNLHILIGPNNSGKTNLLDAIEFLFSPDLDPSRFYDPSANLNITVKIDTGQKLQIIYCQDQRSYFLAGQSITSQDPLITQVEKSTIRILPEISIEKLINQDLKSFKRDYQTVYQEFCRTLQDYFTDIEISEKLFLESVHTDRQDRPLVRMGAGFKRLFIMLFYIFHPDYDIILIDEPEIHLHPTVLKRFLRVLMDKDLNNQIFLTTHSSVLVQPNNLEHIWRVARDDQHHTKVYGLTIPKINFDTSRLVQELNADNTEMFFADQVLLVEGVSDRIFMRGLLDRFYQCPHDIKVIYAGSKGNVDIYAELFKAFNIPYLVMLDRDALTGTWSRLISSRLKSYEEARLEQKIEILKQKNIFILDGNLEQSYPKKYQIKDTKPLNALYAGQMITETDLRSRKMRVIKEVINQL